MIKTINILEGAESNEVLAAVSKYISPEMNGIDIGSGGSPVFIQAISLDINYKRQFSELVQLKGDAGNLYWFRDSVLDFCYSSHCLEDFSPEDKGNILKEWLRVIIVGGFLILNLPDEEVYREHCKKTGQCLNMAHKDINFNINKLRNIVNEFLGNTVCEELYQEIPPYSFLTVYRKLRERSTY